MKNYVKRFFKFINESEEFQSIEQLLNDDSNYSDEWAGHTNLAEWLEDSQEEDPENYGLDVQEAVETVCDDCGQSPEEVSILGVLDNYAESELRTFDLDQVETSTGYPGAVSILKHEDGMKTYYLIGMYDGTVVAVCRRAISTRATMD